ncbi:MAG: SLOG family protein [Clostridia bacterium]
MDFPINNEKVCCFTGPRPEKIHENQEEIKISLTFAIIDAINQGYSYFITGMSRGFDTLAAKCVIELSEKYDICLIAGIPFLGQEAQWSKEEKLEYSVILSKSRYVFCVSENFHRGIYYARNRFMVNNSSKIIAYYNNSQGGTKHTLDYAKKKGLKIVNITERQISL